VKGLSRMSANRIVIVGAGPVGLVTAIRLADAGIPSLVLEAADTLPRDLRANTFHPPTIDMLDDLGVAKPLIAQSVVAPVWHVRMHETGEFVTRQLNLKRLGASASASRPPPRRRNVKCDSPACTERLKPPSPA